MGQPSPSQGKAFRKGVRGNVIWLTDMDDSHHSLLVDLDSIVPALIEEYGDHPIVYRDRGAWFHAVIHDNGVFLYMERLPREYELLI